MTSLSYMRRQSIREQDIVRDPLIEKIKDKMKFKDLPHETYLELRKYFDFKQAENKDDHVTLEVQNLLTEQFDIANIWDAFNRPLDIFVE